MFCLDFLDGRLRCHDGYISGWNLLHHNPGLDDLLLGKAWRELGCTHQPKLQ